MEDSKLNNPGPTPSRFHLSSNADYNQASDSSIFYQDEKLIPANKAIRFNGFVQDQSQFGFERFGCL